MYEQHDEKVPWFKKKFSIFKTCGGLTLVAFGLIALAAFLGFRAFHRVQQEVTPVATDFIKALEVKDIGRAQQFTAENAMSDAELEKLADARYLLDGFQSLTIDKGGISKGANTNPLLSGTIAVGEGTISYKNGDVGRFLCRAKLVGTDWRLLRVELNVDMARRDQWLKNHPETNKVPAETTPASNS